MAKQADATTVWRADITDFKRAMQEARRYIKLAESEFQEATGKSKKWASATDSLRAKIDSLNKKMIGHERELEALNIEYAKTVKEQGENSRYAQELQIKINNQKASIKECSSQIDKYSEELRKASAYGNDFDDTMDKMNSSVNKLSGGFSTLKMIMANLITDGIRYAVRELKEMAVAAYEAGANFETSMSEVKAIAQATPEDMERITEKAKEMGRTTKFTATEAGNAMYYMAQAGWDTEEILGGIEGVMHLAAAGGQDLAETSDIVTDALTAMGYSAKDANHFADLLAMTAANSNTNVAKMGKTFQYAAPLVGTMGYSMEDAALAIGLMANSGIKAEKAGTALRNILANMVAPTEKQAKMLDALGISLRDQEGNMYSFRDVINQFRIAFKGMDEVERANVATVIAGKRALSGFLAVVDSSVSNDQTFNELAKQIDNCTGASQEMADTMLDNVQGQTTILKSQIEGYMIEVFEHASGSIREAIEIIKDALAQIDWKKVGEAVGKAMKRAVEGLVWLINNRTKVMNTIKEIGKLLLTAFATVKITQFGSAILLVYERLRTYMAGLKAAAAMTSKMNVVTSLLTKLVSPQGLMVAGLTTIGVLLYKWWKLGKDVTEKTITPMTAEVERLSAKSDELSNSYADLQKSKNDSIASSTTEVSYLQNLIDEYNSIIDQNGRITGQYADRANFILTELSKATGIELDQITSVIDANGRLGDSIESVINLMRIQALIESGKEEYVQRIELRKQEVDQLLEEESALKKLNAMQEGSQARLNAASHNRERINYGVQQRLGSEYSAGNDDIDKKYISNLEKQTTALNEEADAMQLLVNHRHREIDSIDNQNIAYENLTQSVTKGTEEQRIALENYEKGFLNAGHASQQRLEQQAQSFQEEYELRKKAADEGSEYVTQSEIQLYRKRRDLARQELLKEKGLWVEHGTESADNYAASYMREAKAKAKPTQQQVATANTEALKSFDQEYYDAASDEADAAAEGWEDEWEENDVGAAGGEYVMNHLTSGVRVNTPQLIAQTQATTNQVREVLQRLGLDASELGKNVALGLANGIGSGAPNIQAMVNNLANYSLEAMREKYQTHSPSKVTYEIGQNFTQGLINGIASETKNLLTAVDTTAGESVKKLLSFTNNNFDEAANNATNYFTNSLAEKVKYITEKATYQNENLLQDYQDTIQKLQDKLSAETDENKKKSIQKEIDAQQKSQKAYQMASQKMLTEFQSALNNYQNETKTLISNTFKGITDTYNAKWQELDKRQEDMISKLKETGELFNVSGAGVMTINDIKAQTKQIKDYTSKLETIRKKVSDELFQQISTYDVKEGAAFMSQLLAMSEKELKEYDKAYLEKQTVSQTLAENLYKKDFKAIEDAYKNEVEGILVSFEALGKDSLKGFVDGFVKNTDYMEESVKTFVKGMVDTFKKELDIHSPSKVMAKLGNFSGMGFVNGLKGTISKVKDAASNMVNGMTNPIGGIVSGFGGINMVGGRGAAGTTNITNNYNLVQNNTSPKSLSALDTYRARRRQIAMVQAVTQ